MELMPRVALTLAAGALLAWPGLADADPKMVAAAKSAGLPAQNCQYCHTAALPKKETFKVEDLNERGKWLVAEKTKRNAKAVEAAWLKEYKGK
jgi:hypothetical protein